MTDNLSIWERFADIDPQFTKSITGKDYKGTSPNAHYVIKCLTQLFGPVGQGFGWRVLAEGIKAFGDTSIHWCRIEFWHTNHSNRFEAYGQTKMAYKTQQGYMKVDEDAPKKSLTDAITKAASQVGIAANIFLGRWDDNKYVAEVNNAYREAEKPARATSDPQTPEEIQEAADWAAEALALKQMIANTTTRDYLNNLVKTARFDEFKDRAPDSLVQQVRDALKSKSETYRVAAV